MFLIETKYLSLREIQVFVLISSILSFRCISNLFFHLALKVLFSFLFSLFYLPQFQFQCISIHCFTKSYIPICILLYFMIYFHQISISCTPICILRFCNTFSHLSTQFLHISHSTLGKHQPFG